MNGTGAGMPGSRRWMRVLVGLAGLSGILDATLPAAAQEPPRLPPAAEADVRLEQLPQIEPEAARGPIEIPETAPTRAPAGAEQVRLTLRSIEIEGTTVYPPGAFVQAYTGLLGTEIALSDIYVIATEIQRRYREDGYFLTRAIVPAQTVRDGRFRIQVVEGHVSAVIVEGEIGPVERQVRAYLNHVLEERPLRLATLERYLLLARDIPGLDVAGVLRPAADVPGAAELVATVSRKRFDALALVDNIGSSFTGEWELAGSVSSNSFTGYGERLTLTGLISSPQEGVAGDAENQKTIQFGGSALVGSEGAYAAGLVSYGDSNPGAFISQFEFDSKKLLASALGGYPFIRSRDLNVSGELGFDYINSNTDVFDEIKFSRDRLRVLHLTGFADFRDRWRGSTRASLGLRQGLPIFGASESGDELLSREDGTGVFTTIHGSLSRLQPLPLEGFTVFGLFAGQYAFDDLLSDEEFGAGGTRFGRGYDPREISRDHGVGVSGELQYTQELGRWYIDRGQLFGFYDFGQVWERGGSDSDSLASAGGGARLWVAENLTLELQVAKPLTRDSERADGTRDPQVLFRAIGQF